MQITGFKLKRFYELSGILQKELRIQGFGVAKELIRAGFLFLTERGVDRKLWRARIRACNRCLIYNPKERTCRRGDLGCGCYMPFKARVAESTCWSGKGWGPKENPPVREGSQVI